FVGYQLFRADGTRARAPYAAFTERARLAELETNGVRVVLFIEEDPQGQPLLRATFTPIEEAFHLYSKDLDPRSVGGVGMPTTLELLPQSGVKAAGAIFVDALPVRYERVSIYPDGPVTLRLPIRVVGDAAYISAQVAVSYMACNTGGICLRPVERRVF